MSLVKKAMENLTGLEARLLFRSGKKKRNQTSGWCKAYKQANMAMIPTPYATDFSKFCDYNSGSLPVLYESLPGEKGCSLAKDSDVTTDLPAYKVWKNGEMTEVVDYATEFDWSKMVSFYLGCSFSFDDLLIQNGIPVRNLEQKTNVSMFKTNIKCYPVGPFQCNMVVSMRPIPEHQLSLVADITSQVPDVHGAPVHIGNPDDILISDSVDKPDFGASVKFHDGDIPVFWACGVTNSEAIKSAKLPLALTHHPGMMYFSDVAQEKYDPNLDDSKKCTVIKYSSKEHRFSILSLQAEKILKKMEKAILDDPGERGISNLFVEDDFVKSSLALSHASSIALITGFPCHQEPPFEETDGLPGVYSIAAMLQALGKEVTIIVDKDQFDLNMGIMKEQVAAGILRDTIKMVRYIDTSGHEHSLLNSDGKSRYDVVLATERCGRSVSGRNFTMKGRDISSKLDPIDDLFETATKRSDIVTIGIGDGGNELGMGKVLEKVQKFIPYGEKIVCNVAADLVISAGVSNWGCYALSLALYALRKCEIHDRYFRRATGLRTDAGKEFGWAVPTVEREFKILEIIEAAGYKDGIKPDQKMSVDGLKFQPTHADKIKELRNIVGI